MTIQVLTPGHVRWLRSVSVPRCYSRGESAPRVPKKRAARRSR